MGRRSECMFLGTLVLGTAATFACFHRFGTWPCLTDALKMAQMGSVMKGAMSFSIQLGIASGPVDLCTLIRVSFW